MIARGAFRVNGYDVRYRRITESFGRIKRMMYREHNPFYVQLSTLAIQAYKIALAISRRLLILLFRTKRPQKRSSPKQYSTYHIRGPMGFEVDPCRSEPQHG
jgi:hypothetical protein